MNIVVVGGTGLIGKHLVRTILNSDSHKLIIIDNLSNSNLQEFYEFVLGNNDDIQQKEAIPDVRYCH